VRECLKILTALTIGPLALLLGTARPVTADEPNLVTAIDILLEPDATMVKHAEAANERLLKEFPKGFALGKTHKPHVSCLQRYVKTADLDKRMPRRMVAAPTKQAQPINLLAAM